MKSVGENLKKKLKLSILSIKVKDQVRFLPEAYENASYVCHHLEFLCKFCYFDGIHCLNDVYFLLIAGKIKNLIIKLAAYGSSSMISLFRLSKNFFYVLYGFTSFYIKDTNSNMFVNTFNFKFL